MGEGSNPLTRKNIMTFAAAIDAKKANPSFGPGGPSDGWWKRFIGRHPDVAMRKPGFMAGGRATTAHISVVNKFFQTVQETMERYSITDPSQLLNIDETAFGEKDVGVTDAVFEKGVRYPCQRTVTAREHITVTLCVVGDGTILPPNLIFKGGFPKSDFTEDGPKGASYARSESGFMNSDLFLAYLKEGVKPHLVDGRKYMLFMDNAKCHITLDTAEFCEQCGIVIVMLPANTTQILQPADQCFAPLKKKMTNLLHTAGLLRPGASIGKSKFPAFLKHALSAVTVPLVQSAWRHTGLYPLDAGAIPKEKFVADAVSSDPVDCPLLMEVEDDDGLLPVDIGVQADISECMPICSFI